MAGRFSLGGRGWLVIAIPLLAALLLLALSRYDGIGGKTDMTEIEARLSATLSCIEGAGDVRAMVLTDESAGAFGENAASSVSGVIIVASGAYDLGVRLRLQQAAMTLFSLDAQSVEVFSGREDKKI